MTEIIHHRGLSAAEQQKVPNSFAGFRERYDRQIELDVFLLADGTIAVLHNKDLGLSQEDVEVMTIEELSAHGIVVPRFEEFAFGCLDRGNGLIIEIKASSPEQAKKLARKLVEKIAAMAKEDKTFLKHKEYLTELGLHSFSIEALVEAKEAMGDEQFELTRGLLWASTPTNAQEMQISMTALAHADVAEGDTWISKGIEIARQLKVDCIDLHWSIITKEVVAEAHAKGLQVIAWVVKDTDKAEVLEKMGVDKIMIEY